MKNRFFQRLGGGRMERFGLALWSNLQLLALKSRKDKEIVGLLRDIRGQGRSLCSAFELYLVFSAARAQSRRPGAMAEVGVYRGGSARLICRAKGDKLLRLFDTFEGLPESSQEDRGIHKKNQYACSQEEVEAYVSGYDKVSFHKGLFPDSTRGVPDDSYCFCHFDVDLYAGTKACLEYFYPRMIHGGIMISHDYGLLAGVEQAFQQFFEDKPEQIIDLPTTQCMVVKLGDGALVAG
ncbi:MAG: TylF/MycF/NovP-related O-methyltransferase [Thermoguttaceae bacterium]